MSALTKFDGIEADYWDCSDAPESLSYDDPVEALEHHLDCWLTPGCDTEAELRSVGGVNVTAYVRAKVAPEESERITDHLFEVIDEWLGENTILGNPDGGRLLPKSVRDKRRAALRAVVDAICADADVWHCEPTRAVELDSDEVIEIMREHRPDWFEVP